MTDDQINRAIAEACGWTETESWLNGTRCFERKDDPCGYRLEDVPDFCNDLNAMHEAESKLKRSEQMNMHAELINVLSRLPKYVPGWRANARQRAEAFLRTLGKWATTEESSVDQKEAAK